VKFRIPSLALFLFVCAGIGSGPGWAQDASALYKTYCSRCHEADDESRAPGRGIMTQMTAEQILVSLEKGTMSAQGTERSRAERRVLAEYLSGKRLAGEGLNPIPKSAFCSALPGRDGNIASGPSWNGWGNGIGNSRFQPAAAAGISAREVPRLKLKWAFAFPGASSGGSQPVVFGGRVYVGSWEGEVYSVDAKTGCIHWMLETESGVPSAIVLGNIGGRLTAYFGDLAANVYAADAKTGKVLWKVKVDEHPLARVRGAPVLYQRKLFVPVSAREESQVGDLKYPCCRFRGSVLALDAASGKQIWKTYMISEEARPTQKNKIGTQLWGPSGVAIWLAPTVDTRRNALYVGTGNDYSSPSTNLSDSIVALDMKSGKIRWARQMTQNDVWNASCRQGDRDPKTCPDPDAPDFDFSASPTLVNLKSGRQLLLQGQKSGIVYALDPDREGKTVWQQRVGKGGTQGGILFGPAADGKRLYVAISDLERKGREANPDVGGGMVALKLGGGERLWTTPHPPCGNRKPCAPVQGAAVTAIPGAVFSGSIDGHLRAYSTKDGKIIWDFDSVREYTTVNGVVAKGGSFYNGGPAVAGGMLFTASGYSHHGGIIPGNVLLAFSVNGEQP
jgi:polyvinyl alcohol dehydrogenase (cytochrome)